MKTYAKSFSISGFSILELMITVAIIGIMAGIALPSYTNYTIRAKVSECLNLATPAQLAVNENVMQRGAAPNNSEQAGFNFSATEYCNDIRIANNGTVVIETQNTGAAEEPQIQLTLDLDDAFASLNWSCELISGDPAHVPSNCRTPGIATGGNGGGNGGCNNGNGNGNGNGNDNCPPGLQKPGRG